MDWKQKIDQDLKEKAEEYAREWEEGRTEREEKEKEQARRNDQEKAERSMAEARELAKKNGVDYAKWQLQFSCHVCGKPPIAPFYVPEKDGSNFDVRPGYHLWSSPNEYHQCDSCQEWTCSDHLHKKICKTCAEKL